MHRPRRLPPICTDLDAIAARTQAQTDDTAAFVHFIDVVCERGDHTTATLDALVAALTADVSAQIDCTQCAHCCRCLPVGLTPDDVPSLAAALGRAPTAIVAHYVDRQAARGQGEWGLMRGQPCPLLHGSLCSVYAARPRSCRAYPALTPEFRWLAAELLRGAALCPIIFNVAERLKVRLGWRTPRQPAGASANSS